MQNINMVNIDFGGMNCQVTFAAEQLKSSEDGERIEYDVKAGYLTENDREINSQIILTDEQMKILKGKPEPDAELLEKLGKMRIGKNLPVYGHDGEMFSYFKVPPECFDNPCGDSDCAKECGITHRQVIACFFYQALKNIFFYNESFLSADKETCLYVGCPATADWTSPENIEKYEKLIKTAAGIENVHVVPESTAAMFSALEHEKINFASGGLCAAVDFGSTTADATIMSPGRMKKELSCTLGAGKIEHEMTLLAYKQAEKENPDIIWDSRNFNETKRLMRMAKEEYYDKNIPADEGTMVWCRCKGIAAAGGTDSGGFNFKIDKDFMDKVTADADVIYDIRRGSKETCSGTYAELTENYFREIKNQAEKEVYTVRNEDGSVTEKHFSLNMIVLTGGASKMDFIYDICRSVFKDDDVKIILDDRPLNTVSKGLGWVSLSDSRFDECLHNVLRYIYRDDKCSFTALKDSLSDSFFERICEVIAEQVDIWVEEGSSVHDLMNSLNGRFNDSAFENGLKQICAQQIAAWKDNFSDRIIEGVNGQVRALYAGNISKSLAVGEDVWEELKENTINAEFDSDNIVNKIDISGIGKIIERIAVYICIWILGLIFAVSTGGLSLLAAFFGTFAADELVRDKNYDKKIGKRNRKMVRRRLKKQLDKDKYEILDNFKGSLNELTRDYQKMVENTAAAALEIATLKRFSL